MKRLFYIVIVIVIVFITTHTYFRIIGGDVSISYNNDEILINRFPNYSIGYDGIYHWSNADFPFDKVDKYIYKIVKNSPSDYIIIKIVNYRTDEYGVEVPEPPKYIGAIDVINSKKYKNFLYWNRKYSVERMYLDYHNYVLKRRYNPQIFAKSHYSHQEI